MDNANVCRKIIGRTWCNQFFSQHPLYPIFGNILSGDQISATSHIFGCPTTSNSSLRTFWACSFNTASIDTLEHGVHSLHLTKCQFLGRHLRCFAVQNISMKVWFEVYPGDIKLQSTFTSIQSDFVPDATQRPSLEIPHLSSLPFPLQEAHDGFHLSCSQQITGGYLGINFESSRELEHILQLILGTEK